MRLLGSRWFEALDVHGFVTFTLAPFAGVRSTARTNTIKHALPLPHVPPTRAWALYTVEYRASSGVPYYDEAGYGRHFSSRVDPSGPSVFCCMSRMRYASTHRRSPSSAIRRSHACPHLHLSTPALLTYSLLTVAHGHGRVASRLSALAIERLSSTFRMWGCSPQVIRRTLYRPWTSAEGQIGDSCTRTGESSTHSWLWT